MLVEYRPAETSPFGRVYSGGIGFQNCQKETRSYCSAGFYVEDDLVNAFQTIMRQVFNKAGLKTPFLGEYVDNRERVLQVLGTESSLDRGRIKELFLISMHGEITGTKQESTCLFCNGFRRSFGRVLSRSLSTLSLLTSLL